METDGYVDIYLLPVPEKSIEAYRRQATTFGQVAKEHGRSAIASSTATISVMDSRRKRASC